MGTGAEKYFSRSSLPPSELNSYSRRPKRARPTHGEQRVGHPFATTPARPPQVPSEQQLNVSRCLRNQGNSRSAVWQFPVIRLGLNRKGSDVIRFLISLTTASSFRINDPEKLQEDGAPTRGQNCGGAFAGASRGTRTCEPPPAPERSGTPDCSSSTPPPGRTSSHEQSTARRPRVTGATRAEDAQVC